MANNVELLLVILKHHGTIAGRKRFQKIVFLLQRKHGINLKYKFIPYYYGPYSKDLQFDIDLLRLMGFIEVRPEIPYAHTLSKKGQRRAEEIEKTMDSNLKELIDALEQLKNVPTSSLIEEAKALVNTS